MINIKTKTIVVILAVAVLVSIGFYFVYKKYYLPRLTEQAPQSLTEKPAEVTKPESKKPANEVKPATTTVTMKGYKLYKNADFGFEIQYPESWFISEEKHENVRGEVVKEFFFIKPSSDLRFAVLPRDGLSYGLTTFGTSTPVYVGGFPGMQTQYVLKDGRRLWLLYPQTELLHWLRDLGRIDAMTTIEDPIGDTRIFEQMLSSFKLMK